MNQLVLALFCLVGFTSGARPYTQEDKDKIVALHNKYRAEVRSDIENYKVPCRDVSYRCKSWAHTCKSNFDFMINECYKTCGFCDEAWRAEALGKGQSNGGSKPGACEDEDDRCPAWANNGECRKNPKWMRQHCKKSCKVCTGGSSSGGACADSDRMCPSWAKGGECKNNPGWMLKNCKKSCRQCGHGKRSLTERPVGKRGSSWRYPDMVWSESLARVAQQWVDKCTFTHMKPNKFGENLAWDGWKSHVGYSAYNQTAHAIIRWANEKQHARRGWSCMGGRPTCLHYTQMIWLTTTEVGCAVKNDCPGQKIIQVVCEYNEKGNMMHNRKPKAGHLPPQV